MSIDMYLTYLILVASTIGVVILAVVAIELIRSVFF